MEKSARKSMFCKKCHIEKSENEFYFRKDNRKYRSVCKACNNKKTKEWVKYNPEKRKEIYTKSARKSGIGIEISCKICGENFKKNSFSRVCSLKCRIIQYSIKNENGCWIWIGAKANEYGKCRWLSKWYSAHRASYLAFKGDIKKRMCVCHHCDIKLCVNPDHLYVATQKENIKDAIERGLIDFKKINKRFKKFSDNQIEQMKKLKEEGFTYERLSRIFNSSSAYICKVIKGPSRR